jgi:hypothetical protein
MSWDYVVLWALTVINSFVILLLVRQLALMPKYTRAPGPRLGSTFGEWALQTMGGRALTSKQMPEEYVMLFASESCGPCHTLFAQLAHVGRSTGTLVVAAEGNATKLERAARTANRPLYDEFLEGVDDGLMQRLQIPSTPFAVAIRQSRVVAAGPARTPAELETITAVLRPASTPRHMPA